MHTPRINAIISTLSRMYPDELSPLLKRLLAKLLRLAFERVAFEVEKEMYSRLDIALDSIPPDRDFLRDLGALLPATCPNCGCEQHLSTFLLSTSTSTPPGSKGASPAPTSKPIFTVVPLPSQTSPSSIAPPSTPNHLE